MRKTQTCEEKIKQAIKRERARCLRIALNYPKKQVFLEANITIGIGIAGRGIAAEIKKGK